MLYSITAFPVPESPKASDTRVASLLLFLSLCLGVELSFGVRQLRLFLIFGLFTVYMCTWLCRFYVDSVLEIFSKISLTMGFFFAVKLEKYTSFVKSDCGYTINMLVVR